MTVPASVPSFLVGLDALPQTFVPGYSNIQIINPTMYKVSKYIQYWVNLILSPAWETIKTNLSLSNVDMRQICPDESWSYVPWDIISLTDVNYLPRWNVSIINGGFETETNELFWIDETYQVMMIMKPITDPKLFPFLQIQQVIPRVIGNALKTNIDGYTINPSQYTPGTMYWDKCELTLGKFEIGPTVLPGGKANLYQCMIFEIGVKSQMETIYSGVQAAEVDITLSADFEPNQTGVPQLVNTEIQELNAPWTSIFGANTVQFP